jgi:hypothetical protein
MVILLALVDSRADPANRRGQPAGRYPIPCYGWRDWSTPTEWPDRGAQGSLSEPPATTLLTTRRSARSIISGETAARTCQKTFIDASRMT